ncbi:hypothetical protein HZS_4314, partial [Henneguya salminicola]
PLNSIKPEDLRKNPFIYSLARRLYVPNNPGTLYSVSDRHGSRCWYSNVCSLYIVAHNFKSEYIYLTVFYELIVLTKYSWMLQVITSDFEISLISSLIMLLFPSKKTIERKLKKYKVSEHNCGIILSKIELLAIVPIQEIPPAIRYLNSLTTLQPELISFWSYFDLIWRRRFEPQLWNILNINGIDIAGRTNNALERYSKRIGENFANAHPNLPYFISIIRSKFQYYSERCTEIRQNSSVIVYQSERFSMPEIDLCYLSWKQNQA